MTTILAVYAGAMTLAAVVSLAVAIYATGAWQKLANKLAKEASRRWQAERDLADERTERAIAQRELRILGERCHAESQLRRTIEWDPTAAEDLSELIWGDIWPHDITGESAS